MEMVMKKAQISQQQTQMRDFFPHLYEPAVLGLIFLSSLPMVYV